MQGIDYKLAKQLKDAGFPQELKVGTKYYEFVSHPRMGVPPQQAVNTVLDEELAEYQEHIKDWVKIPTLSELIDACGEEFGGMVLDYNKVAKTNWKVYSGDGSITLRGKTPIETVANLYLALNDK